MSNKFTESTVEEAILEWAEGLEYAVLHGPEIAPDEPGAERESFGDVILVGRLGAEADGSVKLCRFGEVCRSQRRYWLLGRRQSGCARPACGLQ